MVSLKVEKEILVTGMTGTTPWEILLICSSLPIGYGCYGAMIIFLRSSSLLSSQKLIPILPQILLEIICCWIPTVICQSSILYPYGVLYLFIQLGIIIVSSIIRRSSNKISTVIEATISKQNHQQQQQQGQYAYDVLTIYRAGLMLHTLVAILAVDFPLLFPRELVKTETYGYGYMDLGASSFVVAAGFVTVRARRKQKQYRTEQQQQPTDKPSNFIVVPKMIRKVGPVIGMGLIRLVTHTNINYQEHIAEYGIHWNFFFTLSWLAILPYVTQHLQQQRPTWLVPIVIFILYQFVLSLPYTNLQYYIEYGARSCTNYYDNLFCHLFAANREGIVGCIPYSALYLLSEKIAYEYIWTNENSIVVSLLSSSSSSSSSNQQQQPTTKQTNQQQEDQYGSTLLRSLLKQTIVWTILWQILVSPYGCNLPVSRRSTNIPFCIWTLVVTLWQITGIYYFFNRPMQQQQQQSLTTTTPVSASVPIVLYALNQNGLLVFIIGNLLTGIVNLSIDTILVDNIIIAFLILYFYCTIIGIIAISIYPIKQFIYRRVISTTTDSTTSPNERIKAN